MKQLLVTSALVLALGVPFALTGDSVAAQSSLGADAFELRSGVVHCNGGRFDFRSCQANPLLTLGDCFELRQICEGGRGGGPF